ncbi:type IV pilus biogenesis protein PilM, partial [Aeromonas caviae]
LHAETALGTGRMTSTFECSKKWGDYHLSTLVLQIRRNVQLFCSSSGNKELSRLVLTGGGSLLPGLAGQIGSELNCEVLHPDPFALFGKPQGEGGLTHGAKYMTALGLALRSFTPCQI